mmetsp:Transcript_3528/g.10971  ORF Transcript_3528/g.10971 Transcript_3528/m.10971 type:complete len:744 (-) Transcript_3528:53-2284(-)|eukprot:CAMPEP_0174844738 /NCGR_PEP_ID=MMETSP1114-20130205/11283_1 /TAXON_ID=312471 /ORGANISM="Neobodo designis, Strain CCAP 1951/1" /LENGTH=743 /DNA_ID=CAMNT_0016078983 /DNA_START=33 /DNA_END=2264 /DNA_ORIENTATION=+
MTRGSLRGLALAALLVVAVSATLHMADVSSAPAPITIDVDLATTLAMGGASATFDRATFINVHSDLNNRWKPSQVQTFGDGNYSAAFGRAINRPIWLLGQTPRLADGSPNVSDLAKLCARYPETEPGYAEFFTAEPDQRQYIESLNVEFWFQAAPSGWRPRTGSKGYYPHGNTTEMGDLYTAYLSVCVDASTQGAVIVECMNEPFVHTEELKITAEDVIDAHVAIAKAVHGTFGRLPLSQRGVDAPVGSPTGPPIPFRVAGPTAAWPEFQMGGNFSYFRTRYGAFVEQAALDMDLLSIHLYDTYNSDADAMVHSGPWNASSWATRRIGGNIHAVLDLIETVSAERQVRAGVTEDWTPMPMEVSEYGTGFAQWKTTPGFEATNRGYWAILIGVCGKTLAFIDRADTIVKAIPFIIHDGSYNKDPPAPFGLYAPPNWTEPTVLTLWYAMWEGVRGTRVWSVATTTSNNASGITRATTQSVVLRDNATAYVLLNNLDAWATAPVHVALGATAAGAPVALRTLRWCDDSDAPVIDRSTASVDATGTLRLPALPPDAFVVAVISSLPLDSADGQLTRRWRLSGAWLAPGDVTAFPSLAPKSTMAARRHVHAVVDVTRAASNVSVATNSVSLVAARLCFSSFAGSPREYASNLPQLAFVNHSTNVAVPVEGATMSFSGYSGRSPDDRIFDCFEYNLRVSTNAHAAFVAGLHVPASHPSRLALEVGVGIGHGEEPDLELSSLVLIADTAV